MYKLDLEKVIKKIKSEKAKKVLLHLPNGLKPKAKDITDELRSKTSAEVFIWSGSCFGACDIPIEAQNIGIDLIIHFGHTNWRN
ncbi:MAG: diphthamide synthesis protein [Nanoarchaeota archaeon]|nr:diphthamide synthesis protein [Nanoarchaeota archaeon]MBU1270156.1 diphthamide synthesis protein [Nanoarchaeota archaeon]MBU1603833.1 diphthamide synthesis protein [Nanoarchaeota archaeon]MBU2443303.1 diphthamide synthesis protein [Nanoarchaeota archaeon]